MYLHFLIENVKPNTKVCSLTITISNTSGQRLIKKISGRFKYFFSLNIQEVISQVDLIFEKKVFVRIPLKSVKWSHSVDAVQIAKDASVKS